MLLFLKYADNFLLNLIKFIFFCESEFDTGHEVAVFVKAVITKPFFPLKILIGIRMEFPVVHPVSQ